MEQYYVFVCSFQFPTMQQIGEDLIHVLDQLKWVQDCDVVPDGSVS